MLFWTYMLHCRGGYFYVGHTDDLERRLGQHFQSQIAGFTADHQPVELAWAQDFPTREEAKACERQLKGWSKPKKLALIRGDWGRISTLAKNKCSPSTGSGRSGEEEKFVPYPDRAEPVEALSFSLVPHPETRSTSVRSVQARVKVSDGLTWLTFEVSPATALQIPDQFQPTRTDGLWRTTCMELFVGDSQAVGYREYNFSPSREWAAYCFSSYRSEAKNVTPKRPPAIGTMRGGTNFYLFAAIEDQVLQAGDRIALSAVIEETNGTKSYWALAHPPGKPDFHHPTCFAATLPAPDGL
jgi:predicted GIY-YIG superfamily endonuclease